MDFDLSDDQRVLRDEIIRFSRRELNAGAGQRDRDAKFPRDLWEKCGEMGFQGLPVPESYGGSGLDSLSTAIALEALGYGCEDGGLVFSICAHLLSCVVPIWKHGTDEQRERYLPGLCSGKVIGVNAITEPDSGSDAYAMQTRAEPDGAGFRLNGTKIFASNGPVADLAIVFAVTDAVKRAHGGITAFLVNAGTPGFEVGQKMEKMGLRSSPLSELVFSDVHVASDAVVGGIGGGAALFHEAMNWERACLFASHVGAIERLLERSVEYARVRKQFGHSIGKFQGVSHPVADMRVRLEAARLLVYKAAWTLDHKRDASLESAMAKLFVSESLTQSAVAAHQIHGGYGYLAEYDVERFLRDAMASTLYSGTSEMQRNLIARWLGL